MTTFVTDKLGNSFPLDELHDVHKTGRWIHATARHPDGEIKNITIDPISWDRAREQVAPMIYAPPGYYILQRVAGGSVVKVSIIAWRFLDGTVVPVTMHAMHQSLEEAYAILCPDGRVEYDDGSVGRDIENFRAQSA